MGYLNIFFVKMVIFLNIDLGFLNIKLCIFFIFLFLVIILVMRGFIVYFIVLVVEIFNIVFDCCCLLYLFF